jgi:lysophospholipase L1-like esterase
MQRVHRSRLGRAALVMVAVLLVARPSSAAVQGSLHIDRTVRANGAIAMVGDSLTYSYWSALPGSFRAQQWGPFALEARSARRTLVTTSIATSGVEGIRRIRATGFDPDTWIIALGTNDMNITYQTPGATDALIDALMAELGNGHHVVWVNVYARDFPAQTRAFNAALTAAMRRHANLAVADWYGLVMAHPNWIGADGIHPTLAGAEARNSWVATLGFTRFCPPTPPVVVPPTVVASVGSSGANATAQAVRLCVVSG